MKMYSAGGSRGIAPLILNLGAKWDEWLSSSSRPGRSAQTKNPGTDW